MGQGRSVFTTMTDGAGDVAEVGEHHDVKEVRNALLQLTFGPVRRHPHGHNQQLFNKVSALVQVCMAKCSSSRQGPAIIANT